MALISYFSSCGSRKAYVKSEAILSSGLICLCTCERLKCCMYSCRALLICGLRSSSNVGLSCVETVAFSCADRFPIEMGMPCVSKCKGSLIIGSVIRTCTGWPSKSVINADPVLSFELTSSHDRHRSGSHGFSLNYPPMLAVLNILRANASS